MPSIAQLEVLAVDLPFKGSFKHAAAERVSSYSVFVRCQTDTGAVGWGESLPREYVTGESRDGAVAMLRDLILPRLPGTSFASMDDVRGFLAQCDGQAPADWVPSAEPQTAAWCAVDLALLDAFGRAFGEPALAAGEALPERLRYSGVVGSDVGFAQAKKVLKMRLYGLRHYKLKIESGAEAGAVRFARRLLGARAELRADANMAWSVDQALARMREMSGSGVRSFEQPLPAGDLDGLARLVRESGLDVMADESLSTRASLERLIERRACTALNVRISKCGGLIAALARCRQARAAGLKVQVGCQVGESSLLSAAQLALLAEFREVDFIEGCFGLHLLREDPARPVLQFGRGGRPPARPGGAGLGVEMDEALLRRHTGAAHRIAARG